MLSLNMRGMSKNDPRLLAVKRCIDQVSLSGQQLLNLQCAAHITAAVMHALLNSTVH